MFKLKLVSLKNTFKFTEIPTELQYMRFPGTLCMHNITSLESIPPLWYNNTIKNVQN